MKTIFKKIFSNLLTYCIIGVCFIGVISFIVGLGYRGRRSSGEFNPYVTTFGAVLLLPFFIYYLWSRKVEKKEQVQSKLLRDQIIATAKKTEIDLKAVTVIDKGKIKVIKYGARPGNEFVEMNNLELIFPRKNGRKIRHRLTTRMDAKNVEIYLYLKGTTYLYIDKHNNKHLDLDFLHVQ